MITRFFKHVGYAVKGIALGIKEERNVRIDIVIMAYVLFFSSFYNFDTALKALVVLVCFIIPAFEMMNTSVERTVKNPHPDRYMIAGEAKDTAAGAVLIAAIGALIAGVIIFWDITVFKLIYQHFTSNLSNLLLLLSSLVLSYAFITSDNILKRNNKGK